MNEFKKLMGDAISDETAVALQTILDTHLQESKAKADEQVQGIGITTAEDSVLVEENKKDVG